MSANGQVEFDSDGIRYGSQAIVLVPDVNEEHLDRSPQSRLDEACGLARAIELEITVADIVRLPVMRPATLFGTGKVEEVGMLVKDVEAELVIVDHSLTPVQQRNLERAWKAKVIDRTGLILEIFGERARTREGRFQVELAHLTYQRSRLVRSWTHLERQRGGFGFLGGPGETQIEADRRAISERIEKIKKELGAVATRRRLQRRRRQRREAAGVALVGYTNAGKSTLFNTLTRSDVYAENLLFATLDPTMRQVKLPGGLEFVLSDTVGFVSDLPTSLIAAFRATLEEVSEADLILHVRDISDPDTAAQASDVEAVLSDLGIDPNSERIIEVWNKIDLIPEDLRPNPRSSNAHRVVQTSALTGEGLEELMSAIADYLTLGSLVYIVDLTPQESGSLHRLYKLGQVLDRTDNEDGSISARVRVSATRNTPFCDAFPRALLDEPANKRNVLNSN